MKMYLVGGAVRDRLLGLKVSERDFVVVGATAAELSAKGFKAVGKDFPVFLHPKTHEEYALARTERKVAPGYAGFVFHAEPTVSLEEDLMRRDLTINAIAEDEAGHLIDPFGGEKDLKAKILRHVSSAFKEDPVRILRIARFAARFPDFKVADETYALMKEMVENGEVNALVPERVWQELERALNEKAAERFFEVLEYCGALKNIFPELKEDQLAVEALIAASQLSQDGMIRFAALLHHLSQVTSLCQRIRAPSDWRDLAELTQRYLSLFQMVEETEVDNTLNLFQKVDAYRRPQRFAKWLIACQACLDTHQAKTQAAYLEKSFQLVRGISLAPEAFQKLKGEAIQEAIYEKRKAALMLSFLP